MKKVGVLLLSFLLIGMFAVSFVAAQVPAVQEVNPDGSRTTLEKGADGGYVAPDGYGKSITEWMDKYIINPGNVIFKYIVGDSPTGDLLFVKFLVFLLILGVAVYATKRVPTLGDNGFLVWLIALIIAILGARFLSSDELVNFVWLPSGVIAVVFATLLPFIIYFFFMESFDSTIIRKVGWIAFAVIFFGLSIYRWDDLAVSSGSAVGFNLAWLYVIIAVLSILAIVFDKKIRGKFLMYEIEHAGQGLKNANINDLQKAIKDQRDIIANTSSTPEAVNTARKEIKKIEGRIQALVGS